MKTIMCFGDSNTHGYPSRPLQTGATRYPFEQRWTSVAQRQLGSQFHIIPEGLNGRTTVHDDPIEGIYKNGARMLLGLLESHTPLDAVVLMLGTNDLKARFGLGAADIAAGTGTLLKIIQDFSLGQDAIKVLLVCPPPILEVGAFQPMFAGGAAKSKALPEFYEHTAMLHGVSFLDAGTLVQSSTGDGIHFDAPELEKLGKGIAAELLTMLS